MGFFKPHHVTRSQSIFSAITCYILSCTLFEMHFNSMIYVSTLPLLVVCTKICYGNDRRNVKWTHEHLKTYTSTWMNISRWTQTAYKFKFFISSCLMHIRMETTGAGRKKGKLEFLQWGSCFLTNIFVNAIHAMNSSRKNTRTNQGRDWLSFLLFAPFEVLFLFLLLSKKVFEGKNGFLWRFHNKMIDWNLFWDKGR